MGLGWRGGGMGIHHREDRHPAPSSGSSTSPSAQQHLGCCENPALSRLLSTSPACFSPLRPSFLLLADAPASLSLLWGLNLALAPLSLQFSPGLSVPWPGSHHYPLPSNSLPPQPLLSCTLPPWAQSEQSQPLQVFTVRAGGFQSS